MADEVGMINCYNCKENVNDTKTGFYWCSKCLNNICDVCNEDNKCPVCENVISESLPLNQVKVRKPNYCVGFVWGLDFCRALNERNWFCRLLFRLAVGKYAYMEFKGLWDETKKQGCTPDFCYGLEDIDYHTAGNIRGPDWAYYPFVYHKD